MKKKLLSLALVVAMALTLLPTAAFAATCTHTKEENGETTYTVEAVGETSAAYNCTSVYVTKADTYYRCTGEDCGVYGTVTKDSDGKITDFTPLEADADGIKLPNAKHQWGQVASEGAAADYTKCNRKVGSTFCNGTHTHAKAAAAKYTQETDKVDEKFVHSFTCEECSQKITEDCVYNQKNNTECKCGRKDPDATEDPGTPAFSTAKTATAGFDTNSAKKILVDAFVSNAAENTAVTVTQVTKNKETLAADKYTATIKKGQTSNGVTTYSGDITLTDNAVENDAFVVTFAITGTSETTTASCTYTDHSTGGDIITPTPTPTPETPKDENKAPTTNSQGIPVANEVTTSKQADQAIGTLKNTNANTLQENLLKSDSALSSFQNLENAVRVAKNVQVEVDVDRAAAPSAVRGAVSVSGAAFNAASSNSTVKLVVTAPSQAYAVASGYQVSMTLTGVSNPAKLDVPVVITLPLPSDVRSDRVVVLHYHGGSSTPSTIVPLVVGNNIRFTVTGFSDFVITDEGAAPQRGSSSGFVTVNSKKSDTGVDSATLAAISSLLTGDGVFTDVPKEHWAAKEIRWARDGGLMSGYGTGAFGPNGATTRQQLWMVLARLDGLRPSDMSVARQWAMNAGVSDGTNPNGALSRQQLVTMLYRFAKSKGVDVTGTAKLSSYADGAKVASYAKDAMSWAVGKGIVTGSGSKLNPEGTATRAHFAVFLYRYSNG